MTGAKTGLVAAVIGGVMALVTLGLLAALLVALFALSVPVWAATLITLVIFLIASGVLLAVGLRGIRRGLPPVPHDTIDEGRSRLAHSLDAH